MGLFVALIAALDQYSKYLVLAHIAMGSHVKCIPGLVYLTYVQNYGAAFSSLQGARWLFLVIFAVFAGLLIWSVKKNILPFTRLEQWCLAAILGGGLGNAIDRLFRGFVVDMIATDFMDFPVFNVADSFITCGAILLAIHLVFWNREFWKDDKK